MVLGADCSRRTTHRQAGRQQLGDPSVGYAGAHLVGVSCKGLDGSLLSQAAHVDDLVGGACGKRVVVAPVNVQRRRCRPEVKHTRAGGNGTVADNREDRQKGL
jgi:hypothetical protein